MLYQSAVMPTSPPVVLTWQAPQDDCKVLEESVDGGLVESSTVSTDPSSDRLGTSGKSIRATLQLSWEAPCFRLPATGGDIRMADDAQPVTRR